MNRIVSPEIPVVEPERWSHTPHRPNPLAGEVRAREIDDEDGTDGRPDPDWEKDYSADEEDWEWEEEPEDSDPDPEEDFEEEVEDF